jgi:uncharacterized protein YpmB
LNINIFDLIIILYKILYYFNYFYHKWSKELHTEEDLAITPLLTKLEKLEHQDQKSLYNTSKREDMGHVLHMIVAIAERELMVLLNLDHLLTKDYQKDKKLFQDHTEVSFVQVVLNQE